MQSGGGGALNEPRTEGVGPSRRSAVVGAVRESGLVSDVSPSLSPGRLR